MHDKLYYNTPVKEKIHVQVDTCLTHYKYQQHW